MNRQYIGLVLAVFVTVFGINTLAIADDADARGWQRFSNRSIEGFWGYSGAPAYILPPGALEPTLIAGMGRLYFDGKGKCIVTATVNVATTQIGPVTSDSCVYQVNPDGTGTSTATFSAPGAPPSSSVAFIIVDHGRELRVINTDTIVGSLVAKRQ